MRSHLRTSRVPPEPFAACHRAPPWLQWRCMRFVATCKAPPRPHRARASSSKTTTGAASQAALPGSLAASDSRSAPGRRVLRSVQTDPYPKRSPRAPVSLRPTGQTDDQMRLATSPKKASLASWKSPYTKRLEEQLEIAPVPILRILCSIGSSNGIKRGKSAICHGLLGTLHASAIGDQGNNGVTVTGLAVRPPRPRSKAFGLKGQLVSQKPPVHRLPVPNSSPKR